MVGWLDGGREEVRLSLQRICSLVLGRRRR